jgi:hypothetical protein
MFWKRENRIKPYGYDRNGDRSAPDYDWRRDPWRPDSPVFGQWPRYRWLHDAARQPIWWAVFAWFAVTFALFGLYEFGTVSSGTMFVAWIGRYVVLLACLTIAGIWVAAAWFRRTPRSERGPVLRQKLRRAPSAVAWFAGLMAICIGLDILEKRYGVPWLLSFGGVAVLSYGIMRQLQRSMPHEQATKERRAEGANTWAA